MDEQPVILFCFCSSTLWSAAGKTTDDQQEFFPSTGLPGAAMTKWYSCPRDLEEKDRVSREVGSGTISSLDHQAVCTKLCDPFAHTSQNKDRKSLIPRYPK